MDSKLTYLYGWGSSGKSTLLRLLDGHTRLGVMPFHDTIINIFALPDYTEPLRDEFDATKLDIRRFRQYSARSKYYLSQRMHEGMPAKQEPASDDTTSFLLDGFDFYDLGRAWIGKINDSGDFTPENILETIFRTFFHHWKAYPIEGDEIDHFVGTGCVRHYPMRFLLENFDDSRIVFVRRDPRGIVATEGSRPATHYTIDDLLARGQIFNINAQYQYALDLAEEFPERLLIIDFRDLILNTVETLEEICNFVDIEYEDILGTPTFCGELIETQTGAKYVGSINDDWRELLDDDAKQLAALQLAIDPLYRARPTTMLDYVSSIAKWKLSSYRRELRDRLCANI